MARILKLDAKQYFQGSVVLVRGDDWAIDAHFADRISSIDVPSADLEGMACTGFLPASDPALGTIASTGVVGCDGRVQFVFPGLQSLQAQLSQDVGMYAAVLDSGSLQTIFTPDQAVIIRDPGFQEF